MADPAPPLPEAGRELDPRVERSRRVILSAALEVLGDVGYGSLTIEAVAARAGVGKSTIYRHWSGKLELVEDAFRTLKAPPTPPTGGSVQERVVSMLQQLARNMADSTWSTCLPAIIEAAERDPEVLAIHRRLASERRQVLLDVLADGVARGELPPSVDLDLLADCLVGPIITRRLLRDPLDPALVPQLVAQVMPRPPGSSP
ncbi:MAG: TetR/AcrR family transcriptional regulator [Actinomycetota bacterium]|nr:TetR/AcrR family transcriptional regulator [Actinomycetota bacterium]